MTQNCISLQVLAASDADAEEERVGNEINRSSSQVRCKGVVKGEGGSQEGVGCKTPHIR